MVTKVKSGVIGDNTVGITQLNVSDGSNGQVLTTNGSGTLSFTTISAGVDGISSSADATAITINSSEHVGIGTTSPASALHVDKSVAAPAVTIHNTGGADSSYAGLEVETSTTGSYIQRWVNSGTEHARITGVGKLGIGTTSPTVLLDVYNGSGWGRIDVDGTSGGEIRLMRSGTSYAQIYANDSSGLIINAQNGIEDIFLKAGGATKLTIDSSGCTTSAGNFSFNPGTGNLGQRYMIINAGTSNDGGFILKRDNTNKWQIVNSTTDDDLWFYSYSTSSTVLAIDRSTGNLGVGTTSPAGKLDVTASHSGQIGYFNQTGTGGGNHGVYIDSASTSGWTFLARNGGTARFGITGTEARFFNGVTVQAGTSTSDKGSGIRNWASSGYIGLSGDLTGYAAGSYSTLKANGSYIYFDIGGSYSAYMASNGSINANSDRTLKQNITTLSSGQLAKVCSLRGVNFEWIDERSTGTQVGLIAQEIQEEYPELVDKGGIEDGTLTVNYAGLVSPLIEAIKELKTELDAAKARITTLEG